MTGCERKQLLDFRTHFRSQLLQTKANELCLAVMCNIFLLWKFVLLCRSFIIAGHIVSQNIKEIMSFCNHQLLRCVFFFPNQANQKQLNIALLKHHIQSFPTQPQNSHHSNGFFQLAEVQMTLAQTDRNFWLRIHGFRATHLIRPLRR